MIFTSLALLGAIVLFSNAAPLSPPGPTHYVNVSNVNGDLTYDPPFITAGKGDMIEFQFRNGNHTVTQSSFDAPCTSLNNGIDTNFMPVTVTPGTSGVVINEIIVIIVVENTDPMWMHCRQAANTPASHCGQGMVFAVNPGPDGSNNSYAAYKAKALATGKASNGTACNGTTPNGTLQPINGTASNGPTFNGTASNSPTSNGPTFNCTASNGTPTNATTTNDTPTNSTTTNGTPTNATPTNGTPTNATATPTNATPTNATPTNATPTNATPTSATTTNDTTTNDTWTNSTMTNGTPTNDTKY